jgi:putative ATP-binding cassette transporter
MEYPMFQKSRAFLGDIWALTKPYWQSEEKWRSGLLLGVIVALHLGTVYLNVVFNKWNNLFYNTLQDKNFDAFLHQFIRFCYLAVIFIVIAVYRVYLRQMLEIRWRRWLTDHYVGHWLGGRAYYRLQLAGGDGMDNPDQRISDDIASFINQTLVFCLGLMESVVTLVSFTFILWGLSGTLHVAGFAIPGYMLWVAIVYSGIGTWLAHRIGRPLIMLGYRQQQYEADFRYSLVRLRENAEGVALYGGEGEEARNFSERFTHIVRNWWDIMRRQKKLTWFSAGYGQVAMVFPFIVAAPRYFSGAIQLGGLMQTASAFGQVQGALSWFVDAYTGLAAWKATVDRLTGFERSLTQAARATDARVDYREGPAGGAIAVENLDVHLPDGAVLLRDVQLTLPPGSRTLITGPSGCGKSTLFRAISGLWPHCRGRIGMPAGERILFLPQKPYLPVGTLRRAIAYPDSADRYDDPTIRAVLAQCGLDSLNDRLDDHDHWAQRLSLGEQQRLAVARALLLRPRWLFLDEATSNLDEAAEQALYRLLTQTLIDTAIVSIAHRPTLGVFHNRQIDFTENGGEPRYRLEAPEPIPIPAQ